jgi:dihydroorotate dehydrogenase
MYSTLRPLIFTLSPERAHGAAICALRRGLVPAQPRYRSARLAQRLWGLDFLNPVGLAAGFDKNAEALSGLARQGFGFLECGTVTPRAQPGNPRPRMFRLTKERAVINRLGFNNAGLDVFMRNLAARPSHVVIGGNIGKNKDSTDAAADYVAGLNAVYAQVDYITINISSPNTPGLRDLQSHEALSNLLRALNGARAEKINEGALNKPILVKVAPDLDAEAIALMTEVALSHEVDGLVVGNTTLSRPGITSGEAGGLSGAPLMPLATQTLAAFARATRGRIPLIGVGGIASAEDAYQKILHGASLLQLYTALVYEGFALVPRIAEGLDALLARDGFTHISEAVGKGL